MNTNRRKFLKLLVLGGGFALISKIFGDDVVNFFDNRKEDAVNAKNFDNFDIIENNNGLKIYSKNGEELFVIDNEK